MGASEEVPVATWRAEHRYRRVHPSYEDDYSSPSSEFYGGAHGPYRLAQIYPHSFQPVDRSEAIDALREMVASLGREVRTRRLVIVDRQDDERIVGEVEPGGVAEFRLDLPGCPMGNRTSAMLFSNPGTDAYDLLPGAGVEPTVRGLPPSTEATGTG
jgi:hypothetical protein